MRWLIAAAGIAGLSLGCSQGQAPTPSATSGSGGSTGTGTTGSGGSTGYVDPGCAVSEQGVCNGTVATDCYQGDLDDAGTGTITEDCSQFDPTDSSNITCDSVSGDYLDYGVACVAAAGTPCAFVDNNNNEFILPCAGPDGQGCILDNSSFGSRCQDGFTPCQFEDDGGPMAPSCAVQADGGPQTLLVENCNYDQPIAVDCGSFGGTCSNAQCIGLTYGAPCDPVGTPGGQLLLCLPTLGCVSPPDGGYPACG